MIKLNNIEALNNALTVAMEKDERIVLFGEDAGFEGGVFRATQGLQEKFGEDRVFDAPIAESTIAGTGVGLAIAGMKPIVEMQFQGFSYASFQQLFTHAARIRNRSRGRFSCPLIVRMPMGGGVRALEHHSEAIEAMFAHVPGIKVVMPSNPYDTKGMMLAALKSNDPVVFLESKKIYRSFKQEVPEGEYEVELGKANIIKEGESITLVTYGAQVHDSIKAIQNLGKEGSNIDVELIDLRTISPIDTETIINSVKKTGRLLVVHEAVKSFSVSSEIITRVNEKAFEYLEAPLSRLTGFDITIPLATSEKIHSITPEKIATKLKEIMAFKA
ncbi:alpha-ketoacid dehydrogenase subunit beta [Mycoplasma marinum]|uniref:Alpha-ketoacid dehydrogenase subunit beta n=1 Tax=Mycoplasma marinum TaxID=1937190 RepID=A0A4R0XMX5_9MOLU|nr:alpha-ketoacid dehydrogenase subunit beta [Mycoplasma marinum]TCG11900.1 alpha-ketoacid dehydrogenase subunit beta [Mycoplasma marinum]